MFKCRRRKTRRGLIWLRGMEVAGLWSCWEGRHEVGGSTGSEDATEEEKNKVGR